MGRESLKVVIDQFYDIFLKKLLAYREYIVRDAYGIYELSNPHTPDFGNVLKKLLPEFIRDVPPRDSKKRVRAYGVDGGVRSITLSTGKKLVVVRAVGVAGCSIIARDLDIHVVEKDSSQLRSVLLLEIESRVARKVAESAEPGSILFIDGSFYTKVVSVLRSILIRSSQEVVRNFPTVLRSVIELEALLRTCRERGVEVVFVSKDHSTKRLLDYALSLYLMRCGDGGSLSTLMTQAVKYYSMSWHSFFRRKLRKVLEDVVNDEFERLVANLYIRQSVTDATAINAVLETGYTVPLKMGLCDAKLYHHIVSGRLFTAIRKAIAEASYMLPDAAVSDLGREFLNALANLPPVISFYVKLRKFDTPLLVEFPVNGRFVDTRREACARLEHVATEVFDTMNLLYIDRAVYNIPLYYADAYARLRGEQFRRYVETLRMQLLKYGIDIGRRDVIGGV